MKTEKFKVLLYLKKSSPDKSGKTPIMGRITVGKSMVQFSCKLLLRFSLSTPNGLNPPKQGAIWTSLFFFIRAINII